MRNKEEARSVFINIVLHSWTYGKMTAEERKRCLTIFDDDVKGSFEQRMEIYHKIYAAFLTGLGYDGFEWRNWNVQNNKN